MDELTHYGHLSDEHRAFVFMKLALKCPYNEIKQEFEQFFETKLDGRVIINLQAKFKDEIKSISEQELNNLDGVPISHSRVRLEIIYKGLLYAMKERTVGNYKEGKLGHEEWIVEKDINHTAIKNYLQLAQNEEFLSKKLLLEYMKAKELGVAVDKPKTSFKPIQVNANLVWDEAEAQ